MGKSQRMKKSTQVAIGGLASALCLVLMFMTGIFPFATYALPAMSGIILVAVVIENGASTAWLVYIAVSLLSIFIVPDKEAAIMFVAFLGYYPIIKQKIEKIKFRPIELLIKFGIFNAAIFAVYSLLIRLVGASEIIAELGEMGKAGVILLVVLGNITFAVYDFALTTLITVYVKVLRERIIKKLR